MTDRKKLGLKEPEKWYDNWSNFVEQPIKKEIGMKNVIKHVAALLTCMTAPWSFFLMTISFLGHGDMFDDGNLTFVIVFFSWMIGAAIYGFIAIETDFLK